MGKLHLCLDLERAALKPIIPETQGTFGLPDKTMRNDRKDPYNIRIIFPYKRYGVATSRKMRCICYAQYWVGNFPGSEQFGLRRIPPISEEIPRVRTG